MAYQLPYTGADVSNRLYKAGTAVQPGDLPAPPDLSGYVATTDPRLSDTRDPKAHTHTKSQITDLPAPPDLTPYALKTDTRFTDARTPTAHTHTKAQITDLPAPPDLSPYVLGTDTRLSDARAPTAHTHTKAQITDLPAPPDLTPYALKTDSRFTDARTPTAHTHTKAQITDFPIRVPAGEVLAGGTLERMFTANDVVDMIAEHAPVGGGGEVPATRTIATSAPITGGGDLSANRTIGISAATTSAPGSMSAADKTKLDGVAAGATANDTDANLKNRANHTGTQAASTITGLSAVATSGSYNDLSGKPTIPAVDVTVSTESTNATIKMAIVAALPATPDAGTLYFVTG